MGGFCYQLDYPVYFVAFPTSSLRTDTAQYNNRDDGPEVLLTYLHYPGLRSGPYLQVIHWKHIACMTLCRADVGTPLVSKSPFVLPWFYGAASPKRL